MSRFCIQNSQDPFLKQLGKKITSYPNSRCDAIEGCFEKVASGGHVLIHVIYLFKCNRRGKID